MAHEFGRRLAEEDLGLVYGGARVGTMGVVSGAALAAGGEVIGVIPQGLVDRELARDDLTDLRVVESMHGRKALMNELSDAFVVLAGGFGTFEEFFEIVTWAKLGLHQKPIVLLDRSGYFTPLTTMLDHATEEGFIDPAGRAIAQHASSADEAIKLIRRPAPPQPERFQLRPDQT